jgi:hypothetical protein
VNVQQGRDGKLYPAQMPPPAAWRWRVIKLTHALAHERGLSVRATQRELASRGYRRSLGSISYDLSRQMPTCSWCRSAERLRAGEVTAWQPETTPVPPVADQQPGPAAAHWQPGRPAGGGWAGPA